MKIKRRDPAIFDLAKPWAVDVTLIAPDPAGYRAVIVDESNVPIARSLPEEGPMEFANRRFHFVFVPPVHLDYGVHRYRLAIMGPSGDYVPFESRATRAQATEGIRMNCPRCKGTGVTRDTKMQCPICISHSDDDIPFKGGPCPN